MSDLFSNRLPVMLITGFLGAGKTTFLNWLLSTHPELPISVIVNEFGEIHLESQFITQKTDNVIELANGCMCCMARSDVPRVIRYIREHSPQTKYVLIEASGLSDPDPIIAMFQGELADEVRLEGILTVVDALNFVAMRQAHPIINSQLADADLVLLSKVTEAGPEQTQQVIDQIHRLRADLRIVKAGPDLNPELFLDVSKPLATHPPTQTPVSDSHQHDSAQAVWFVSERPIRISTLEQKLRQLPVGVIRAKGVIKAESDQKLLLQFVGGRFTLEPSEWKDGEPHQTAILCLGTDINEETIRALFVATEVTHA